MKFNLEESIKELSMDHHIGDAKVKMDYHRIKRNIEVKRNINYHPFEIIKLLDRVYDKYKC